MQARMAVFLTPPPRRKVADFLPFFWRLKYIHLLTNALVDGRGGQPEPTAQDVLQAMRRDRTGEASGSASINRIGKDAGAHRLPTQGHSGERRGAFVQPPVVRKHKP